MKIQTVNITMFDRLIHTYLVQTVCLSVCLGLLNIKQKSVSWAKTFFHNFNIKKPNLQAETNLALPLTLFLFLGLQQV